ncbi:MULTISPECIES: hypothetical protein [Sphingobacterium]|uniref:Natural product n=2 Tax=Sphingobacterium TaxID=28453 RepID=A0A420B7M9_SPHD1|nr:hypothetical protein [Sphingobacterium detergens]RKE52717.1 hypothetical protein DFQ12_2960 [Sphingobacterium detergens]
MKKISLANLNLKEIEQLSRGQLKDVLGGWNGGTSPETNPVTADENGYCPVNGSGDDWCSGSCTNGGTSGTCVNVESNACVCQ